jgi:poly(A) polymerase-like protein
VTLKASEPPLRTGDKLSHRDGRALTLLGFVYPGRTGGRLLPGIGSENDLCLLDGAPSRETYRQLREGWARDKQGPEPEALVQAVHRKHFEDKDRASLDGSVREPIAWARDPRRTSEVRDVSVREVVADAVKAGFCVWVAGGAVRDALIGMLPQDIDLAGTAPFGGFAEVLQETLRRFKLNVGINSDRHVLYVHDTLGSDRHPNRVFEYAPLKAKWCSAERLFYFDGDLNKDSFFRDLSFNALYVSLKLDDNGSIAIDQDFLDPTAGTEALPSVNTRVVEPRILPWPQEIAEGAPAMRFLRLVKFIYKKKDSYNGYGIAIDCSNAFTLLSGGHQDLLDDFNSLTPSGKRSLFASVFGSDVDRAALTKAFDDAGNCGVDRGILNAFLQYA